MDQEYDPRLALVEAETRFRQLTLDEPNRLKSILDDETDKVMKLKQIVDQDSKAINSRKKEMLNHSREAKFYQDKINQLDQKKLVEDQETLRLLRNKLLAKQNELNRLNKCLQEFDGIKPTNADLRKKIDELKSSCLNLEMTFVGDSP